VTTLSTTSDHVKLVVSREQAGERLDRFLVSQLAELSRSRIQSLVEDGFVQVDGAAMKR
jgi:23S rRNA-/tRNA-specific pseudouridylate synthase